MNLRRHFAILRRSAPIILLGTAAAIVVAVAVSLSLPRTYEAQTTLYVGQPLNQPQLNYNGLLTSQVVTQTYARLATTGPLLTAVAAELKLSLSENDLFNKVTTNVPLEGTLLEIAVRDQDPKVAAAIANSVARQLLKRAPADDPAAQKDLQGRISDLDATIARVQREANQLQALHTLTQVQSDRLDSLQERLVTFSQARASLADQLNAGSPNALTVVDPAVPPVDAVAPNRVLIVAATAIVALAVAILLAYLVDAVRDNEAPR